ncbi:unnamed protein product [Pleuronectes platessa]|uniref:Uncharacterized protein n=1 Tax=Pleuronectes platessa TaxID=8262 RepID=A0A9N7VEN4_PLEPL|nr:unnamed protein product [Pleuronectes platessa]
MWFQQSGDTTQRKSSAPVGGTNRVSCVSPACALRENTARPSERGLNIVCTSSPAKAEGTSVFVKAYPSLHLRHLGPVCRPSRDLREHLMFLCVAIQTGSESRMTERRRGRKNIKESPPLLPSRKKTKKAKHSEDYSPPIASAHTDGILHSSPTPPSLTDREEYAL